MKILSAAILIACAPFSTASAQLGKDASYFCTTEVAGGLTYDVGMKKWKGTAFNADGKFVLRLKHLRTRAQKSDFGETVYEYKVTITEAGSNLPYSCDNFSEENVTMTDLGWVRCNYALHEFKFNLNTNRFLTAYLDGYADGKDNKKNTPSIEGGACTKID
jgi:hypothetical protein